MSLSKQSVGGIAAIPTMLWAAYLKSLQNNPKLTKVCTVFITLIVLLALGALDQTQDACPVTFELPMPVHSSMVLSEAVIS